ncbi:hypothetical protein OIU78_022043 [Salix suchowensis]|nr:hypothetical protein OIU78_022043 [Salix suchowensis]
MPVVVRSPLFSRNRLPTQLLISTAGSPETQAVEKPGVHRQAPEVIDGFGLLILTVGCGVIRQGVDSHGSGRWRVGGGVGSREVV